MEFQDFTDYCQAAALAYKLVPDSTSYWRKVCREYSRKFNTPLHEVYLLDPEMVLTTYYEDQLDSVDLDERTEDLLDAVYGMLDPEYEKQKRIELDNFIEQAKLEEKERIAKGKPIHPGMKNETTLQSIPDQPAKPKQGMIDLSYLEKETMLDGGGFED